MSDFLNGMVDALKTGKPNESLDLVSAIINKSNDLDVVSKYPPSIEYLTTKEKENFDLSTDTEYILYNKLMDLHQNKSEIYPNPPLMSKRLKRLIKLQNLNKKLEVYNESKILNNSRIAKIREGFNKLINKINLFLKPVTDRIEVIVFKFEKSRLNFKKLEQERLDLIAKNTLLGAKIGSFKITKENVMLLDYNFIEDSSDPNYKEYRDIVHQIQENKINLEVIDYKLAKYFYKYKVEYNTVFNEYDDKGMTYVKKSLPYTGYFFLDKDISYVDDINPKIKEIYGFEDIETLTLIHNKFTKFDDDVITSVEQVPFIKTRKKPLTLIQIKKLEKRRLNRILRKHAKSKFINTIKNVINYIPNKIKTTTINVIVWFWFTKILLKKSNLTFENLNKINDNLNHYLFVDKKGKDIPIKTFSKNWDNKKFNYSIIKAKQAKIERYLKTHKNITVDHMLNTCNAADAISKTPEFKANLKEIYIKNEFINRDDDAKYEKESVERNNEILRKKLLGINVGGINTIPNQVIGADYITKKELEEYLAQF